MTDCTCDGRPHAEDCPRYRDTRAARWPATVRRARREAEGLKGLDFEVTEPPNFDSPPHLRSGTHGSPEVY